MVIKEFESLYPQAGLSIAEVNLNGPVRHRCHPEDVIGINVRIEVVDLLGEYGRSCRTGIYVKSNEGKSPLVLVAVRADKLALAEAHIRLEGERGSDTRRGVDSGAAAANVRETNEPIEVGYLRRIVDAG